MIIFVISCVMFSFCNHCFYRCDADPAALAKYVFALVKKDKPVTELRSSMVEQLDVFLQSGMCTFVHMLVFRFPVQVLFLT
jgi:hypothetical protein